jgi:hypothetical protein
MLNAAVHGASVDPRATEWAMDVGPQLIQSFEEKLAQQGCENGGW